MAVHTSTASKYGSPRVTNNQARPILHHNHKQYHRHVYPTLDPNIHRRHAMATNTTKTTGDETPRVRRSHDTPGIHHEQINTTLNVYPTLIPTNLQAGARKPTIHTRNSAKHEEPRMAIRQNNNGRTPVATLPSAASARRPVPPTTEWGANETYIRAKQS